MQGIIKCTIKGNTHKMKCCLYIFVINELSNPIHASNELFVFVDACMSHDI